MGLGPGMKCYNILCRNVYVGLRQGPIVSYCASSVPSSGSSPGEKLIRLMSEPRISTCSKQVYKKIA